jgi:hypothetical protein
MGRDGAGAGDLASHVLAIKVERLLFNLAVFLFDRHALAVVGVAELHGDVGRLAKAKEALAAAHGEERPRPEETGRGSESESEMR